jgi:hypothetical protein
VIRPEPQLVSLLAAAASVLAASRVLLKEYARRKVLYARWARDAAAAELNPQSSGGNVVTKDRPATARRRKGRKRSNALR